jgi:hypothetical protein
VAEVHPRDVDLPVELGGERPETSSGVSVSRISFSAQNMAIVTRIARWFIFKPKIPICFIFVGFGMEKLDIFYGHFGTFKSTLCILPPFGIFCGNLVYIFPLWYVRTRKIWQP